MSIDKFNFGKLKPRHAYCYSPIGPIWKYRHYCPAETQSQIKKVLYDEAADYCRRIHKVPDDKLCYTYLTKDGKVAVLELTTPKKRLLFKEAENQMFSGDNTKMDEFRKIYGFIPKPSNVLKKYIDYGYMKSQDVEHVYHNLPVDYRICDDLTEFENAYRVNFDDKDVLMPGFNGFSCMSEEPKVGAFYYYFGAKMLIFYKQGTNDIVGRMVLWQWEDKLYYYKGYVKTQWQVKAAEVVDKLAEEGKIHKHLPGDFITYLQGFKDKTPDEILEIVGDEIRVPYIDKDLMLNGLKTNLNFCGVYACKSTACKTLNEHGVYYCDECGEEIDEDDVIEIRDYIYCNSCAKYCEDCEEWFAPDADGDYVDGPWVCEDCLSNYCWCEECEKYHTDDKMVEYKDEDGIFDEMCDDCADTLCRHCDDCGYLYLKSALTEVDGERLCPECLENKKEA